MMAKARIQLVSGDPVDVEGFTAWEADNVKIQFHISRDDMKEVIAFPMQNVLSYSVIE